MKTIFIDIDGCLVTHNGAYSGKSRVGTDYFILDGVKNAFHAWDKKGYIIILTTGRRESTRAATEQQLRDFGLFWDQLIMGCGRGTRILINDFKPDSEEPTAIAYNLERNEGLGNYINL